MSDGAGDSGVTLGDLGETASFSFGTGDGGATTVCVVCVLVAGVTSLTMGAGAALSRSAARLRLSSSGGGAMAAAGACFAWDSLGGAGCPDGDVDRDLRYRSAPMITRKSSHRRRGMPLRAW